MLAQHNVKSQSIELHHYEGLPYFFKLEDQSTDIPFDFFALVFYLLSRYEEYVYPDKDDHGRWASHQAVAVQGGFIHLPIIDLWLHRIHAIIEKRHSHRFNQNKGYQLKPTIDIDLPYAYKTKFWRNALALIRDIILFDNEKVKARIRYLLKNKDPFDQYDYLIEALGKYKEAIFFFLCRFQSPYDENFLLHHRYFEEIVKKVSDQFKIGIHPSYSSNKQSGYLKQEIDILSELSDRTLTTSRQHYLKLSIPHTYQSLIYHGIQEDHSMLYADQIGFRASTAHPFYWFDLNQDKLTTLTIHSPCMMDVTLKDYLGLSPRQAIQQIEDLKKIVTRSGGSLEFIWHNSSFSEAHGWTGWQEVFEYLLRD